MHSAHDPAALVRDFVKWADPASLQHFAESAVRAYEIAMTPPRLPVVLVADTMLQQRSKPVAPPVTIPPLGRPSPPGADPSAIRTAARRLVAARNPLIVAGRAAQSAEGLRLIVELAETLQASVYDETWQLNFPTRHPLNVRLGRRSAIAAADVILALEPDDLFSTLHRLAGRSRVIARPMMSADAHIIRLGVWQLTPRPNYQTVQRHMPIDLDVVADAETALPALIEAVRREMTSDQRARADARRARAEAASRETQARIDQDVRRGWDARPISTARLSSELWSRIEPLDWSLVSFARRVNNWPLRLWDFRQHHQFIGGPGGDGVGYTAPAAAGAALANRKHGRVSICIQPDGDLLMSSSILWTLAHHRIPLLLVMNNNRAYYQEQLHLRRFNMRHAAGPAPDVKTGTALDDPNVDFAGLARSMGVDACGPIEDPDDLAAALTRGVAAVQEGRPFLIDVVTQGR